MNETLSRVDELLSQGSWEEAHQLLSEMPSSSASIAAKKGRALNGIGRSVEALQVLEQALALDGNCAEALGVRGAVLLGAERLAEAQADLNRAIALQPDEPRHVCNRAFVLTKLGRIEEAMGDFNTYFETGSDHGPARLVRAQLLMSQQQFQVAISDLHAAIAQGIPEHLARELEGLCHHSLGAHQAAIGALRKSITGQPDSIQTWIRLLKIELDSAPDNAQALIDYGLGVHPDPGTFLSIFREYVEAAQGPAAAVSLFEHAVQRLPDNVEVSVALGRALKQAGQDDRAAALFDEAIRRDQYCHRAWLSRAFMLEDNHALAYFEGAAAAGPREAVNHYNYGSCLLRLGRFQEALDPLQRAISLDPQMFEAYHERGMALDELHRYQEAIEHYDRSLEIEPTTVDSWMNRGNSYRSLGQYDKSLGNYEQAIALQPDQFLPRLNRALTLRDLGRLQETLEELERVVQLEPGFARGWYELGLTHKILETGQHESYYQKACQLDPLYLEHPYGVPRRGPTVGAPPAARPAPAAGEPVPTDEAGRLEFLVKESTACFPSVLPIFTRQTLFSQIDDQRQFEELAMYFSLSAAYLAARDAGLRNWNALPDFGHILGSIAGAVDHQLVNVDEEHKAMVMGCTLVGQFVSSVTQDMMASCLLSGQLIVAAARFAGEKLEGRQHDQGLVDWSQRHSEYQQKIKAMGEGVNFALDLDTGLYHWVRGEQTLGLADMKVLGILGGDGSFLAGWADPQSRGPSRPPLEAGMGLPGELHEIGQQEAWDVVTRSAERLGVDYIETRATGNVVMFLGLSNMRAPGKGEEFQGFQESRTTEDVGRRLLELRERLVSGEFSPADLGDLFRTYGETIQHSGRSMFRDTPLAVRLVETGERVRKMGDQLGKKKLFLLSRGKVPPKVQQLCLEELDTLLNEWGVQPESAVGQLLAFWAEAADFMANNLEILGDQKGAFEAIRRGRPLDGFVRRLQVGGTVLHCGLVGVGLDITQTGEFLPEFIAAAEFMEANQERYESHLLTSFWVLEEYAPGIAERHDFRPLVEALTQGVVAMIERLHAAGRD